MTYYYLYIYIYRIVIYLSHNEVLLLSSPPPGPCPSKAEVLDSKLLSVRFASRAHFISGRLKTSRNGPKPAKTPGSVRKIHRKPSKTTQKRLKIAKKGMKTSENHRKPIKTQRTSAAEPCGVALDHLHGLRKLLRQLFPRHLQGHPVHLESNINEKPSKIH